MYNVKRESLLFWEIVIRVFPLFVSSGDGRKQCQQPYPTHQPLKPFEFSCLVPTPLSIPSPIFLSAIDRYICGPCYLRYNLPHLEGYTLPTIGGTRVFFDRPITSGFTSSPPPFRSTWNYVVTDRRTLFPRLLTVSDPQFSFPLSHMPQRAGFVGVFLLTSCVRETREENVRKNTCVCVAGDLECTFLAQSTIGCAKIAGENCEREGESVVGQTEQKETSEAVQKCGRQESSPRVTIHSESLDSPITCFARE